MVTVGDHDLVVVKPGDTVLRVVKERIADHEALLADERLSNGSTDRSNRS